MRNFWRWYSSERYRWITGVLAVVAIILGCAAIVVAVREIRG